MKASALNSEPLQNQISHHEPSWTRSATLGCVRLGNSMVLDGFYSHLSLIQFFLQGIWEDLRRAARKNLAATAVSVTVAPLIWKLQIEPDCHEAKTSKNAHGNSSQTRTHLRGIPGPPLGYAGYAGYACDSSGWLWTAVGLLLGARTSLSRFGAGNQLISKWGSPGDLKRLEKSWRSHLDVGQNGRPRGPQMWMSSLVLTIQLLRYLILTHTHLRISSWLLKLEMTEVPSFKDVHLNPIVSIAFRVTRWRIPCSAHNVVKLHIPRWRRSLALLLEVPQLSQSRTAEEIYGMSKSPRVVSMTFHNIPIVSHPLKGIPLFSWGHMGTYKCSGWVVSASRSRIGRPCAWKKFKFGIITTFSNWTISLFWGREPGKVYFFCIALILKTYILIILSRGQTLVAACLLAACLLLACCSYDLWPSHLIEKRILYPYLNEMCWSSRGQEKYQMDEYLLIYYIISYIHITLLYYNGYYMIYIYTTPFEFPLQKGRGRPWYKWFIWGHFVVTTMSPTRPFCNRAPKRQSCGFSSVHFVRVLRCKVILQDHRVCLFESFCKLKMLILNIKKTTKRTQQGVQWHFVRTCRQD